MVECEEFVINPFKLEEELRDIPIDELYNFSLEYLTNHKYFKTHDIVYEYLAKEYNIIHGHTRYDELFRVGVNRFRNTISQLLKEKRLIRYNSRSYKRYDPDPEPSDNMSRGVKLVYSKKYGKLVNPKFYDI